MKNYAALTIVALILALTVPAQALTNGSFESGLAGWTKTFNGGGLTTVTQHNAVGAGDNRVYNPTDGNRFARLRAGNRNQWVTIAQQFAIDGPKILSFDWFFDSAESYVSIKQGFNDAGAGHLNPLLFFIESSDLPGNGSTPWISEAFNIAGGNYTLTFGVKNTKDHLFDSFVGVDNVSLSVIPEPMTMMAVACGIGGLAGYIRKRRTT